MAVYTVTAYALSDFSGSFATANSTTPGPYVGLSTTYSGTTGPITFQITDDDTSFDDAYVEVSGAFSTLTSALTVNGVTYPAGYKIEPEVRLLTTDSPPITVYVARIGPSSSNSGSNVLVFTDRPLAPGQSLRIASGTDGPRVPYAVLCFAGGTLIATPGGPRPVESLAPGEEVIVREGGTARLRWVGRRRLGPEALALRPDLRPVRIAAGALGEGRPGRALRVSPQHRILVGDWRAELLFGVPEVLVPARALCNDRTIRPDTACDSVLYVHLLFDRHEVVLSEGTWTESLLPGPVALATAGPEAVAELLAIFPELAGTGTGAVPVRAAYPCLRTREGRLLADPAGR